MIVKPMVRNNICLNAHPEGCAVETRSLIDRARGTAPSGGPKAVLVIGCSTGYGLASRITAAFGYGAATIGFSFEKEPSGSKTGTPGWYANREFDRAAAAEGLVSTTFEMDAFSKRAKEEAVTEARRLGVKYDLIIYSLASPVRVDPETGEMYRSVIKPIGRPYSGRTVDMFTGRLSDALVQPADESEIAQTVKVMGGEDWNLWIDALASAGVLARGATTVAYSYIGPELSHPIYRDGTIGLAKSHLEATAANIRARYAHEGIFACISINKALVTRASAVIPVIPLYVSALFKVMKERGIHEDCLDQIQRLFRDRLYPLPRQPVPVDEKGRIRLDELEMGAAVQKEVSNRLARVNEANLRDLTDIDGFRRDFLRAHGFEVPGVDYGAEEADDPQAGTVSPS
ncbi:MAG: enoyl-ACP reductase FabV [Rectinemataceae bacterium]